MRLVFDSLLHVRTSEFVHVIDLRRNSCIHNLVSFRSMMTD